MRLKAAIFLSSAALAAGASEFVVTNFTGPLHDAATYENAAVPGADDVIVWTNVATHTLESPLAVKGIRENLTNMYQSVSISGGAGLSIGADGAVLTRGTFDCKAPIALATNQTWLIPAGGNNMNVYDLTGRDHTLSLAQSGAFLFHGAIDVAELYCTNAATFLREGAHVISPTRIRLFPNKTLYEDVSTSADLRDILPLSATTNLNGTLMMGRYNYNPQALDVTITLRPGDRLADTIDESFDRGTARLDFGGHTLENRGGEIDMRWSYAYTGAYRQYSGNAFFFYDFNAGILPESYNAGTIVNNRPFEFYMGGGTFTARRMEVGCATDWSRPTRALFAGGTTLLSNNLAHAGMAVALANGPSVGTTRVYKDPDGRVEVTGDALVSTRGIWFGTYPDNGAASSHSTVTNGYGEVLLTGGSLYTGTAGVRTAPARWIPTADGTNTWVTFRMAGGRLGSAPATGEAGAIYVPITLDGTNNTFACENMVGSGCSMYVRGPLLGTGGFTKTGNGALRIYGEHLATGKVTIARGTLMYYNHATTAEVVRAETTLPAATYGWTADSLAGDAGTAVASWAPTNVASAGANTFAVSPLASLGITAPKISAETMNGHRTLAFNAADGSGLGMGGANAATLLGAPSSMTWAFVFRTPTNATTFVNGGTGVTYIDNLSALFGRTYSSQQVAVLLRPDGSIGLGLKNADSVTAPFETVWAPQRDTRFNDPHVLFITWDGATDTYSITMDGYTQSNTLQTHFGSFANSAITIGMLDHRQRGSVKYSKNHFTGEIAEIRYYKNTVLTHEQRQQLGRGLAERYGASLYGYLTAVEKTNAVGMGAREYEIKGSPNIGSLKGDHELYLREEQRIWGSGNVNSGLTLLKGAILDMAHDGEGLTFTNSKDYPPNTHGLTLDGGAIVRFAYHDDGVTSAPSTVSQLTLRGTNVIQVVSTDNQPAPRGVVFQANDSITVEEGAAFLLEGARNATRVVVDTTAKTVSLETSLGTAIIFR